MWGFRLRVSVVNSLVWFIALVGVIAALWFIPGRTAIPPSIEQDNAYIFLAVDRLCDGNGLTSLPPKAPFQPWSWRSDWAVLTQWPAGYPLLIATVRVILGVSAAKAASAINVAFCGIALVAWFALLRRCLPKGIAGITVALMGAMASVTMEHLIHPCSDTILVGMTPVVVLLALRFLRTEETASSNPFVEQPLSRLRLSHCIALGIAAGSLVWIRYAAIFVPTAVGAFLLFDWAVMRRRSVRDAMVFAGSVGVPLTALLAFNKLSGSGVSTQEQFNLGNRIGFDFSPVMLLTSWEHFTTQTLYAYRAESGRLFCAALPLVAVIAPTVFKSSRRHYVGWIKSERVQLVAMCVIALVTVLVTASTLFKGKFDYVGLSRYYDPIRPIYFLLFVGPLVMFQRRFARAGVTLAAVVGISWFVQQDGMRTRERWLTADRPFTNYGRWDHRFGPDSQALYDWIAKQDTSSVAIFSNFQDDIALETGLPVSPIPESREALDTWVEEIRKSRDVKTLRTLFVFEFEDDSRDYFQPRPADSIQTLQLTPAENVPESIKSFVFEPQATNLARIP